METPDMNAPAPKGALAVVLTPADELFVKYLPGRLSSEQRQYAAILRTAFEDGKVTEPEFANLCKLVRHHDIENDHSVRLFFCERLSGRRHKNKDGSPTTEEQNVFFRELAEWSLVGAMGREIMELVRSEVLSIMDAPDEKGSVAAIRNYYKITLESVLSGSEIKELRPNFRGIPIEVIPLLSHDVRKFMHVLSTRTRWTGKKSYDSKIIRHSQYVALVASLGLENDAGEDEEESHSDASATTAE